MREYAQKVAEEYCRKNGILIIRGLIPDDRVAEVQNHVNMMLSVAKKRTREQENADKLKLGAIDIYKCFPEIGTYESPLEEFMDRGLLRHGLLHHFERQFKIGKYRADLACEKAFLILECDGHAYHFTEKSQIERDQKRDKYLSRRGWRILHFEGIAIRRNMDFCIEKVKEALKPFVEVAA